jgi:hypothetical protein
MMTTRVVLDIKAAILVVHVGVEVHHVDEDHTMSSELQGMLLLQPNKVILILHMLVISRLNARVSSTVDRTSESESCP